MSWDSTDNTVTRLCGCEKLRLNVWQAQETQLCIRASRLALGFTAVSFPI